MVLYQTGWTNAYFSNPVERYEIKLAFDYNHIKSFFHSYCGDQSVEYRIDLFIFFKIKMMVYVSV